MSDYNKNRQFAQSLLIEVSDSDTENGLNLPSDEELLDEDDLKEQKKTNKKLKSFDNIMSSILKKESLEFLKDDALHVGDKVVKMYDVLKEDFLSDKKGKILQERKDEFIYMHPDEIKKLLKKYKEYDRESFLKKEAKKIVKERKEAEQQKKKTKKN